MADWYENRHKLKPDMVFRDLEGDLVKLDRSVPGDGTRWYVAVFANGHWSYDDTEIEPSDLVEEADDPAPLELR